MDRLSLTPPLEAGDAAFLAGFSPVAGLVARIWPGQPAVPCPWMPCTAGCCLVLASRAARGDTAAQWLRFLIAEFLADAHRVDGWVEVPGVVGRRAVLLIVEGGLVFEGEVFEGEVEARAEPGPSGYRPTHTSSIHSDPARFTCTLPPLAS